MFGEMYHMSKANQKRLRALQERAKLELGLDRIPSLDVLERHGYIVKVDT